MTQQNSALVEESAAAAESLKEQAVKLAQVVGTFKLGAPTLTAPAPAAKPAIAQHAAFKSPGPAPAPKHLPTLTHSVPPKPAPAAKPASAAAQAHSDEWESF